tara:strand:- start:69 stop:539 length:471 start_codon:yes stop_codon:yes gene_type:complete
MAYSINKVILVGNIGKEPEVRTFQNGNKVVNLSIATGDRWKDKETGEFKSITEWHRVVIFNPAFIQVAEKYIKKGTRVYIEGQLQTRKWQDNAGIEKFTTEVVLQNFRGELVLLDRVENNQNFNAIESTQDKKIENGNEAMSLSKSLGDLDDDIPF